MVKKLFARKEELDIYISICMTSCPKDVLVASMHKYNETGMMYIASKLIQVQHGDVI